MKIVLITDEMVDSQELTAALSDEGHEVCVTVALSDALAKRLRLMDVELMVLNVKQIDRDAIKQLRAVASEHALPSIIFAK